MTLPWVRLDTGFPRNPKTLDLLSRGAPGRSALVTYVFSLAYAGEQGTDGFIPLTALPYLHATRRTADLLVDAGLWKPDPTGYTVHDWADYQPSTHEHRTRAKRARLASCKRWHPDGCTCSEED